jgi:hypothetical protein
MSKRKKPRTLGPYHIEKERSLWGGWSTAGYAKTARAAWAGLLMLRREQDPEGDYGWRVVKFIKAKPVHS